MARTSPTQRARAHCKNMGWVSAICEKWNPYARIRQDLFGFADLIVLDNYCIRAVQVTSGANVSARMQKISGTPGAISWLKSGGFIEVWGWRKLSVRRGGPKRWQLRREIAFLYHHRKGKLVRSVIRWVAESDPPITPRILTVRRIIA